MKSGKMWLALIFVAALLALSACGGTGSTSSAQATATATPTTAPAPTATATSSGTGSSSAKIEMARFSFSGNTNVTIKAGQAVTFDDPASGGGVHQLVTGTQGKYTAAAGAPSQFNSPNGMAFGPGTSVDITFANPGTFSITCMIHPSMEATITVTQ